MTLIETAEAANKAAGIRTMAFANIREAQDFMASFTFQEYPVNILLPFTVNGTNNLTSGIRKAVLPLQGWVLTRFTEDPNDMRTRKSEDKYLSPMRTLAKKFIKRFLESDIIDPETTSVTDTIRPEYLFLNQQTIGVAYTANIPIRDNVC